MKRRTFLLAGAAALTLPVLGCEKKTPVFGPDVAAPSTTQKPYEYQFFTPGEVVTLEAMLARLFPANDPSGAPSWADTGVAPYIDGQLSLPDFRGLHRMMHGGMEFVQAVSTRRFGGSFETRVPDVQDELLTQFQTGQISGLKFPQARWFATFHAFALEGFWGDPKYGGNRDKAVWAWAGLNPHCAHIHLSCGE